MEEIQGPSQEGADHWTAVCLKVGQSTSVGGGGLFYHRHCFELLHGDIKSRLSLSSITFLVCLQGGPLLPAPRAGRSQSLLVVCPCLQSREGTGHHWDGSESLGLLHIC